MKPKVYYLNTGPWPYFIGFTTDPEAFNHEMRRLGIKDNPFIKNTHSNATTHHLSQSKGEALSIICMQRPRRGISREQYAALLAHEGMHVVQEMREQLGDLGCEAEAYLIQQIVQEGLQQAWATNRVRRTKPA